MKCLLTVTSSDHISVISIIFIDNTVSIVLFCFRSISVNTPHKNLYYFTVVLLL